MTSVVIFSSLYTTIPFFFILFFSTSLAADDDVVTPSRTLLAPDVVCNSTLDPTYCKSVLPDTGKHDIYYYTRSATSRSLRDARKFSKLIDKYQKDNASSSDNFLIRALQDCKLMAELNIDFLQSTSGTINSTQNLRNVQIDDLQTLLSTILTNQQTCLDGLQATTASSASTNKENGLYAPLSDGSKLYSVSLALFARGWETKKEEESSGLGRKLLFSGVEPASLIGRLPVRMLNKHHEVFESISGRKILQTSDTILVRDVVVVNPDGSGNFTTINDAIAAAPNNTNISGGYFMIYVVAGVYEEYISIAKYKKNLMIIGDGINQTVITGNRSVVDGWTTFNSATVAVVGQGFVALNITVRNTAGSLKHQAVAVRNGADLSAFYRCSFEGYQDTLYTHSNRQFYRECDVYGTVDFIFGNAAVVFQECNIIARLPMSGQFNAITAQSRTDPNQNTGISIHNCNIKATPELAATNGATKTYLGRPWKEYSRTVYRQSLLDSLIDPSGWHEWSGDFALGTLYYAEYKNKGPGSSTGYRVTWPGYHNAISSKDASNFTVSNFILGHNWLPATGVPYHGGLV